MSKEGGPEDVDPRVVRSRAAAVEAATALFLENGYERTTMDEIANAAGLTKRTLYNNYEDKAALFTEVIGDVTASAQRFADQLDAAFFDAVADDLPAGLTDLAHRLALAILRPPVIALRRLLVGDAVSFPDLATDYFDRAPGRVLDALTVGFRRLADAGRLRIDDARIAAEQFAYLVVGAPLDRAILVGTIPSRHHVLARADAGVETFLARYATGPPSRAGTN